MSMSNTAQRLLAFVPLALIGRSQNLKDETTLVSGYWEDDYRGTPHQGWKVQNKRMEDGDHKYSAVNTTDLVIDLDGQKYHGPFKQDLDNDVGPDNYFTRWFQCESPAAAVIVQYYTAGCGDNENYQGIKGKKTQLSVEWSEDKTISINPSDPQGYYRQSLGPPKGGYNPYSGEKEDGYQLEDEKLQFSCYPNFANYSYWTQRHGVKAIPEPNDEGKNISAAMEPFRIQIEVETGIDGLGIHHFLVLYNISIKCIEAPNEERTRPPRTRPPKPEKSDPIKPERPHGKKPGPKDSDDGTDEDKHEDVRMIRLKKIFRAGGGVVAVIIAMALGGYGFGKCMKKRKLRSEAAFTNGELSQQMSPQMAVASVNGGGKRGYDMRPIEIHMAEDPA